MTRHCRQQTFAALRRSILQGAVTALALIFLMTPWSASARVIHQERSLYSTIVVDQQGPTLCMQFSVRRDQRNQSCLNKRHPRQMLFQYTQMMMASLLLNAEPKRILILGLGGGTLPLALDELLPDASIDVVEIDPAVVRVAREFFGFAPSERVNVFPQDGRVFVKRAASAQQKYDLIMLDAFNGEYIPEHLMTREFLAEVESLLSDDGVLAANTFSISELYHYESVTYAAVFGRFFNLAPDDSGNRVILASNRPLPSVEELEARAEVLTPKLRHYGVQPKQILRHMSTEVDWNAEAPVLTDQYSPANLLRNQ